MKANSTPVKCVSPKDAAQEKDPEMIYLAQLEELGKIATLFSAQITLFRATRKKLIGHIMQKASMEAVKNPEAIAEIAGTDHYFGKHMSATYRVKQYVRMELNATKPVIQAVEDLLGPAAGKVVQTKETKTLTKKIEAWTKVLDDQELDPEKFREFTGISVTEIEVHELKLPKDSVQATYQKMLDNKHLDKLLVEIAGIDPASAPDARNMGIDSLKEIDPATI